MTKQDPVEGRQRETKGDKGGNHDETGSSRRETKGDKWRQTWNHVGTGSSRRETNGDKGGNHDETGSSRRETKGDKGRQRKINMTKQDPVEGRQMETDLESRRNRIQ